MILKMKFNFNMIIGYDLRPVGSTLKVTPCCDLHHTAIRRIKRRYPRRFARTLVISTLN
jgi:hypothetical protein